MATMFFAGIPLEGSGARPLEADLYGAERQGVDTENLSATGNLNIGKVIQYDEHTQRYLSGDIMNNDGPRSGMPQLAREAALSLPESGSAPRALGTDASAPSLLQTTSLSNPALQNSPVFARENDTRALSANEAPPATSNQVSSNQTPQSTSSTETFTRSSETHTEDGSGSTYNYFNNYYSTVNNNNNNENNYTQNNTYYNHGGNTLITIGNITITNGGTGGGGGGTIINNIDTLISNQVNLISTVTNTTINNIVHQEGGSSLISISNILNNNSIGDILSGNTLIGGDLLSNILNGNTLELGDTLTNVVNIGGDLIGDITTNLNLGGDLLAPITTTVNTIVVNTGDLIGDITANLNLGGDLLAPLFGTVNNLLGGSGSLIDNLITNINLDLGDSLLAPVTTTVNNVLGGTGDVEPSSFLVLPDTQLRLTGFASTAKDYGLQTSLLYVKEDWNASLDAREVWSGDDLPEEYDGMITNLTQVSGAINYFISTDLSVGARGSYVKSSSLPSSLSYGPMLSYELWQVGESMLFFTADATRNNGRNEGTAIIRFSYRFGSYGVSGDFGNYFGGSTRGPFGATRVYRDQTTPDESLLLGASAQHDSRSRSIGADGDWRNQFGRVRGSVQQSLGPASMLSYGGNFALGGAQRDDMVHLGGQQSDDSAVVIEPQGDADARMTIYVNGTPRGSVAVGERQVIYLAPYNSYRIRLVPLVGSGLVRVEGGERKVTLYPGNVARLNWQVNAFSVVVAQVLMRDQTPLAGATLGDGNAQVTTNSHGRFQAELTYAQLLTFSTEQGQECQVKLPPATKPTHGVLLYREPLICQ